VNWQASHQNLPAKSGLAAATEVVTVAAVVAAAVTVVVGVEIGAIANLVGMTVVPVNLAETTEPHANLVVKTGAAKGLPLPAKSPKAS
jgi:hypothetical protein